jgi:hypothetical protein
MADITPPDYSTPTGQVRLLIPDVEQLEDYQTPTNPISYIFSDAQLQAFISLYSGNIKLAAAQAKSVLATSEALINKVIKTSDYMTDGAKLGAELRAQAKALQEEAQQDLAYESYDTFLIVQPTEYSRFNSWL